MISLTAQPARWLAELTEACGVPQSAAAAGAPDGLDRLTIASERHRVAILAVILSGLTTLITVFGLIAYSRGSLPAGYGPLLGLACLATIYQWAAWRYLVFAVEQEIRPARFRFYLNALIELSVPTGMIWLAAAYVQPGHAISGPASYVYFLFIILSALRLDFNLSVFSGAVASSAYAITVMAHWQALTAQFIEPSLTLGFSFFMRALLFALGGLIAGLVSVRIRTSLADAIGSMRERERVLNVFGQHVSPAVVDRLLTESPEPLSDCRPVCILVLDIRNFTGLTEKQAPAEVVDLLNTLWDFMIRAVNEHHGFINKFLGDGFLAVFGAPFSSGNDCENAVAAAREILAGLDERVSRGTLKQIQVGLAAHAGEVVVGSVGSTERREYTVIGDVVNVAFRMEALNKEFGSRLVISEEVRRHIGEHRSEAGTITQIRGRNQAIKVYPLQ